MPCASGASSSTKAGGVTGNLRVKLRVILRFGPGTGERYTSSRIQCAALVASGAESLAALVPRSLAVKESKQDPEASSFKMLGQC